LAENEVGSAAIGWFAAISPPASFDARLFAMTGVCGGFTTFSTLSLDLLNMLRGGEWGKALAYVTAQFGLCMAAVWLGWMAASRR
jgi:CrcB protein